mmetsp:Transcript_14923/g.35211  ORF Transcript_14923/g.35211 Transcript_14923/m.35211 type:complete len:868 (+) Transcript_14923:89-2692(+)
MKKPPPQYGLKLAVEAQFEQCLELRWSWSGDNAVPVDEFIVEMVIDRVRRSEKDKDSAPLQPPPDAMVKTVNMGKDLFGCVQNMPTGRNFLVAVVGKVQRPRQELRSPWIRAASLSPADRAKDLGNRDPNSIPRLSCERCSCPQYVPFRFEMNSSSSMKCRCCGCRYSDHVAQQTQAILKAREEKARESLRKKAIVPLPEEALEWDTRECSLWFWTDGDFNPRQELQKVGRQPQSGTEAAGGIKGRVSVVTPTTDSRHDFHEALWKCFEAQAWEDKELVVVETYVREPSKFFTDLAKTDSRLVYLAYQRPRGQDWSIGLKRNIGAHVATGEFIANFDDDDLYAPLYLKSMLPFLEEGNKHAVTLSSWFIYDQVTGKWGFCDPIAWGLAKGMDLQYRAVNEKAYGYGFSYVFRRRTGLELTYEDIDLGEDYLFMKHLQARKGEDSVVLYHDDFGICLHVQHGGNTSNSILLRDVQREESRSLDVMELAGHFRGEESNALAESIFSTVDPPSQRQRKLKVHLPNEDQHVVTCAINSRVSDFLMCVRQQAQVNVSDMSLHRMPPKAEASESKYDQRAIEVLGLAFLAEVLAERNIQDDSECGKQWRKLLEQAHQPMLAWDRIGLRTTDLWLREGEVNQQQAIPDDAEPPEEFFIVHVTCQKSSVKKFFSTQGAVQVRVPVGSDVGKLRYIVGRYLPPGAKVMAEKQPEGVVLLKDSDITPSQVVFSDFKGQQSYYALFTHRENRIAMRILKAFLCRPEIVERIAEIEREAQGNIGRHGLVICEILSKEAYPPILRHFGMPEESALRTTMDCMRYMHEDWEATYLWLETELLMRNPVKCHEAHKSLARFYVECGMDVPSTEEVVASLANGG